MKKYKSYLIKEYLEALSQKNPVPGGGSAAALAGALGVGLIMMVANYSKGKSLSKAKEGKIKQILQAGQKLRNRFLVLVDLDAKAYLGVVKARCGTNKQKANASKQAKKIPLEVCQLCYKAVGLTPYLAKQGNQYLLGDLEIALEMLLAAYNSALILYNHN